jgi:hypothetical protein
LAGTPLRIPLEELWTFQREAYTTTDVHVEVKGAFTHLERALAAAVCLAPEITRLTSLREALAPAVDFVPIGWLIIYEEFIATLGRTHALASLIVENLFAAVARSADAAAGFRVEVVVSWAALSITNTITEL